MIIDKGEEHTKKLVMALRKVGFEPGQISVDENTSLEMLAVAIAEYDTVFMEHKLGSFNGEELAKLLRDDVHIISTSNFRTCLIGYAKDFYPKVDFPFYPQYRGHEKFCTEKEYWDEMLENLTSVLERAS